MSLKSILPGEGEGAAKPGAGLQFKSECLLDGWWKPVSAHRQIRSEPDNDIGLKVRLFLKHECGMPGILEHLHFARSVGRQPDNFFNRFGWSGIFFAGHAKNRY